MPHIRSLLVFGILVVSYATAPAAANPIYTYDATSGHCLDDSGNTGMNPINEAALFGGGTVSANGQVTLTGRNAECVDFAGFNLYKYLRAQGYQPYFILERWNLRGANLNGATFTWTTLTGAQLQGATFDALSMGYTTIRGTADIHTSLHSSCKRQGSAVDCVR